MQTQEGLETLFKFQNTVPCCYCPCGVRSITFSVSFKSDQQDTIIFAEPVSFQDAIKAVELYLSEPINEKWYNGIIRYDSHWAHYDWCSLSLKCRGDLLGNRTRIKAFSIENGGHIGLLTVS